MIAQTLYTLLNHHPIACKAMLDAMATPCIVRHADGHWVLTNRSAEQYLGISPDQLHSQGASGALPSSWSGALDQAQQQAFAQGLPVHSSSTVHKEQQPLHLLCHPVFDEQRRPAFAVFQVLDAPASAAGDAPGHHESFFRTLVEWAPDAMLVQCNGQVVYANPAAIAMFGGQGLQDLVGRAVDSLVHADFRTEQTARIRALEQGQLVSPRNEGQYLRLDGQAFDVEVQGVRMQQLHETCTILVLREISDRIAARAQRQADELALRDAALHTQTILDNMVDGVVSINAQGLVESFNYAASHIFGYSVHEVLGRNVSMLMPEPHRSHHDGYLQMFLETGKVRILGKPRQVQGMRKDGTLFPMTLSVSKVERAGAITFVGLLRDDTEQKSREEEIRRLAFYDPLTHLPNRRLLLDRLQHALAMVDRNAVFGALMFLDLDHFKQLNDTMGHDLGDILLQQVAQRLLDCVREVDSVARFGGDEFVILLEGLGNNANDAATHAEVVANKILAALGQPYLLRDYSYVSTPSVGIVVFGPGDASVDELLKKADVAMYEAKAAGRNTSRFFDPSMQASVSAHAALEKELRDGLACGHFVLHYQVQVDGDSAITGVEALVRWQHPVRGMVSPGEFIPLAEESGLILPLGQWVLEAACTQLVRWQDDPIKREWTMAVNVSAAQLAQNDFVERVRQAVAKTGAQARLLKLEITESMLMSDVEEIIIKMGAIKASGVRMSLDDFGTGYSSLSYLKRLPLDQLKIDQSFVHDLLTDPNDAVIARTVVALGHSLGLKVIAEGVETIEQRNVLLGMGCDAFQGYHFGRPVPADTL